MVDSARICFAPTQWYSEPLFSMLTFFERNFNKLEKELLPQHSPPDVSRHSQNSNLKSVFSFSHLVSG